MVTSKFEYDFIICIIVRVFTFLNSGLEKTVKLLIENGADVNLVIDENETALILATSKGNVMNAWNLIIRSKMCNLLTS